MNIENISYIVTSGVALAAIISPILSNWLAHRSQLRLKEIELTYNNKLNAYNHWCESASKIISPFHSDLGDLYLHLIENEYKALIVADKNTKEAMLKYSQAVKYYVEHYEERENNYIIRLNDLFENVMVCMNNDIK